jgi:hypothetical protein
MTQEVARTLLDQIGRATVLAVSGGRWNIADNGALRLPVGSGYHVEVDYNEGSDDYTVRRVFIRDAKRFIKGSVANVYCDEISEMVWQAHAYRSDHFPNHGAA